MFKPFTLDVSTMIQPFENLHLLMKITLESRAAVAVILKSRTICQQCNERQNTVWRDTFTSEQSISSWSNVKLKSVTHNVGFE